MHINLPTNENATEVSKQYKEQYVELTTVNYGSRRITTVSPFEFTVNSSSVKTVPPVWTFPPVTRGSFDLGTFKPVIEHWPPFQETPESTDKSYPLHSYNPLYIGILIGVLIVIIVWVVALGVFLRNKIQARRQRARPPSYCLDQHHNSNTALSSTDFLDMDANPQLSDQTESSILDIETPAENSPSFTFYQPSAPNLTTQNSTNEQPPSYEESQQNSNIIHSSCEDSPPSYQEAQLQSTKNIGRN